MNGPEAIPLVEGLVGSVLRETSDTANTVPQEAAYWLETVKRSIRRLPVGADVRMVGVNLDAAGDTVDFSTAALNRLLGIVVRNGDAETNYFRLHWTPASVASTSHVGALMLNLPVAARVAANQPTYRFVAWPGGLDMTFTSGAAAGLSMYASDNVTPTQAGTAVADGSAWAVFTV